MRAMNTPWTLNDLGCVRDSLGRAVADCRYVAGQGKAIVAAVNCHDELLEALKVVIPYMEAAESEGLIGDEGCHWPVEIVRAAIRNAEAAA